MNARGREASVRHDVSVAMVVFMFGEDVRQGKVIRFGTK